MNLQITVLQTDDIKGEIKSLFIGYPLISIETLSDFDVYDEVDRHNEDEKLLNRRNQIHKKLCISIGHQQGILGKWVDSALLSCSRWFGSSVESIFISACERVKDELLLESIRSIATLKVRFFLVSNFF